jgi:uncharacterized Zn finger protein (UPF0148 family)
MIHTLKCPACRKVLFRRVQYDQRLIFGCPNCGAEVVLSGLDAEVYKDAKAAELTQAQKDARAFL